MLRWRPYSEVVVVTFQRCRGYDHIESDVAATTIYQPFSEVTGMRPYSDIAVATF